MKGTKQIRGVILGAAALGVIACAPLTARADDTMSNNMATSMTPTAVSGTVVRYYVDQSGYVTAADIQTPSGISLVRFSPYWGQRIYSAYPVGGQASVYVVGSDASGWNVVGVGSTAPTSSWVAPMSDVDLLDSEPFLLPGAKMQTWKGHLRRIITNRNGEVIGLILSGDKLVRVPREVRNIAPGDNGGARTVQLFKGAMVEVRGYEEAPRYGSLSSFTNRIAGQAFIVNGKAAGSIGFPKMSPKSETALFNVDIGGATTTPEEVRAMGQGYSIYNPNRADTNMTTPGS